MELQKEKAELAAQGLGLAALSHDPPEITVAFAERKGIDYPLLNDLGSKVIREYGVLNTQLEEDHKWYGIPFPGTLVLDAEGRVTSRVFEESYRTRMTGRTLALQLGAEAGAAPSSAVQSADDHVAVTLYSSDPVVVPSQEFMVAVEVVARPGIHVYAPGEHSYRPVRFVLEPESAFSAGKAIYPASEDYYFEPLDEHTPVFTGSFRVWQPVVLELTRELATEAQEPGATITLEGRFEYQACDDATCFLPVSVPVKLTLGLRPLEP